MMTAYMVRIRNFIATQERGAAMAEYGLLIALIFIVAIITVGLFGDTVVNAFETTQNTFVNATTP